MAVIRLMVKEQTTINDIRHGVISTRIPSLNSTTRAIGQKEGDHTTSFVIEAISGNIELFCLYVAQSNSEPVRCVLPYSKN